MIFAAFLGVTTLVALALSHSPLIALCAVACVWIASYVIIRRLVTFPPFYMYDKNSKKIPTSLTRVIKGNAGKLWGRHINDPHTDFSIPHKDVEIPVHETGHVLRGWYIPPAVPFVVTGRSSSSSALPASAGTNEEPPKKVSVCVVCVHGAGRDRRAFLRHTPLFYRKGIHVLLCDCREHGISDGHGAGLNYGHRESVDVAATVRYARESLKCDVVVLVGTSTGAVASILAAAIHGKRDPSSKVDGVCAENPFYSRQGLIQHIFDRILRPPNVPGVSLIYQLYSTLGLKLCLAQIRRSDPDLQLSEPEDIIHELSPIPLLLIHGTADFVVPHSHTERLFELAKEPKQLWIAPDAEHTGIYDVYPDEWERRVMDLVYQAIENSQAGRK